MTKEELQALELTEEQIKEVFKINGKDIEKAKGDLKAKETELEDTKKLLADANKEIEDFKELDVEGIKARADDYKEKFEAAETKAKEELERVQFEHDLENAIRDSKAKNVKAVKALLDVESLSNSKNRKEDIKTALNVVAEENDYLFELEESEDDDGKPKFTRPGGDEGKSKNTNPFSKEGFNLTEQGRLFREDPEKAINLREAAK